MLVQQVRAAYDHRDLEAFASLLAPDVTWGDPGHPRGCRNRDDVLAIYRAALDTAAGVEVVSVEAAPAGVLVHLRLPDRDRWQLLAVRDERIVEIRGYEDAGSAEEAAQCG